MWCPSNERIPYLTGNRRRDDREETVVQFSGTDAEKSVILTQRVHPFPFRTRKLSSAVPRVLRWRRRGRVGHGRHRITLTLYGNTTYGGVAQLGEHLPCKQGVMGSNPIISTKEPTKARQVPRPDPEPSGTNKPYRLIAQQVRARA